jgi:hypothetical protein
VFHALRGANEFGIADRVWRIFLNRFFAFLDQSLHGVTGFPFRLCAEKLEAAIQAVDVLSGLLKMLLETFLQFLVRRSFRHFRQRFHELVFGIVEVAEFVDEEITE